MLFSQDAFLHNYLEIELYENHLQDFLSILNFIQLLTSTKAGNAGSVQAIKVSLGELSIVVVFVTIMAVV